MDLLFRFHGNNAYANAPQCNVVPMPSILYKRYKKFAAFNTIRVINMYVKITSM
jgi:hypothetical protein